MSKSKKKATSEDWKNTLAELMGEDAEKVFGILRPKLEDVLVSSELKARLRFPDNPAARDIYGVFIVKRAAGIRASEADKDRFFAATEEKKSPKKKATRKSNSAR